MFDKVHKYMSDHYGIEYLVLLNPEKYDDIYDRIRCFINLESGSKYVFSGNNDENWLRWLFGPRTNIYFT